jgi:hypothetical protein
MMDLNPYVREIVSIITNGGTVDEETWKRILGIVSSVYKQGGIDAVQDFKARILEMEEE